MSNSNEQLKVHVISFNNVKGFLIYNRESAILIDTGHKNTTNRFIEALKGLNIASSAVKLIVLTHTHFDHAGGAASIKKLTGAPVAVHRAEAANLQKGFTPFPRGTRWKGKTMIFIGQVFARRMAYYPSVNPDITIDDELDLGAFGIPGKVLHTPGHTSGSLSVFLNNKKVFVGDNLMGISKKKYFPPFANDCKGVIRAWEKYIESGATRLYPAHGHSVPVNVIANSINEARIKYATPTL